MSDYITIRLPQNLPILETLFQIYYNLHQTEISPASAFLIRTCIGWLFDKSHFPEELYFKWLTDQSIKNSNLALKSTKISNLDKLAIIDERVLYKICPYLGELKQLLTNSELNYHRSYASLRHITPVSTVSFNGAPSAKQLQLQLEETFFSSHPASMRKTVDFVAERIASGCVKYVCNNLVPELKQRAKIEFLEQLTKINKNRKDMDLSIRNKQARIVADKYFTELCTNYCPKYLCDDRCEAGLRALLAPDLCVDLLKLCVDYTIRQAKDKVIQWMQSHVSSGMF